MYVYLLRYATKPQFKIGWAKDVHSRARDLAAPGDFDLAASLCVRVGTEPDCKRVEKILHRAFKEWKIDVDKKNRYPGDTEQFRIEGFNFVVRFLTDNTHLFDDELPQPLPPIPERIEVAKQTALTRHQGRLKRQHEELEMADERFEKAIFGIGVGLTQLARLGLDVFERCDTPYEFIAIETGDPELFERAKGIITQITMLSFSPVRGQIGWWSMTSGAVWKWDDKLGRGEATVSLSTPFHGTTKADWDPAYLEVLDIIPKATLPREPLDPQVALKAWADEVIRYAINCRDPRATLRGGSAPASLY